MGLIRILLALSVVILHTDRGAIFGLILVGGSAAVQSFYIISGFYMAMVLGRKYPTGAAGYRTFLSARVMRLMPAYLAVLMLSISLPLAGIIQHPVFDRWHAHFAEMKWPTRILYAGTHLTLLGQDAVWFTRYEPDTGSAEWQPYKVEKDGAEDGHAAAAQHVPGTMGPTVDPTLTSGNAVAPLPGMDFLFVAQAWTLGVEMLFYLIAPLIVRRLGAIGVMFVVSVAIRGTLAYFGYSKSPWSYRFFPSELAFFLLGSASYHAYHWFERTGREETLRRLGLPSLIVLVAIILFLFKLSIPLRTLVVTGATAVCLPGVFTLTKRNKIDRWIGELSYPMYISHELVRITLLHFTGVTPIWAMIFGTLAFSVALMVLIEQPFDRVRARFVARRVLRERAAVAEKASPAALIANAA